jgi:CBS-domain-containing membrane protein
LIAGVSVADVMRDQVVAVREKARFAEIAAAMRRFQLSSLPVIDSQERVIGLISDDDLLLGGETRDRGPGRSGLIGRFLRGWARSDSHGRLATELMSSPAVTVTEATPAREAARQMYRCRIHQLPVVDATTGRLTGIITRSDLLAVYERPDEDIRREILHDIIEHTLRIPSGRFAVTVVGGTVTIQGRLERRTAAIRLAEAIAHLDGVITVIDHLTYELDDTITKTPRV